MNKKIRLYLLILVPLLVLLFVIFNEARLFMSVPQEKWQFEFSQKTGLSQYSELYNDVLVVSDSENLYALDLNNGQPRWTYTLGLKSRTILYRDKTIGIFNQETKELELVNTENGQLLIKKKMDSAQPTENDLLPIIKPYEDKIPSKKRLMKPTYCKDSPRCISTSKTTYDVIGYIPSADLGGESLLSMLTARDNQTLKTKWKKFYDSREKYLANEVTFFVIKESGVIAYPN